MYLWGKNTWCLALTLFVILSVNLVSAEEVSVTLPSEVNCSQTFTINVNLTDFDLDAYDVKIDITNSSGDRIARVYNGSDWTSTTYYVDEAINNSINNQSDFSLNITEAYNGTADVEIKIAVSNCSNSSITPFLKGLDKLPE